MQNNEFAVKCQFCSRTTKDPSGRCHFHRSMSAADRQRATFGNVVLNSAPKPSHSANVVAAPEDTLFLPANEVALDVSDGVKYDLDISDGYGEAFDEIVQIEKAGKPNEGMLAFTTSKGVTIYFSPDESVDVRIKQDSEDSTPELVWA